MILVLGRVSIGAVLTISLFVFDEGISRGQQAKIISLDEKLAPRDLSPDQIKVIADELRPYGEIRFDLSMHVDSEPMRLTDKIEDSLLAAGWKEQPDQSGTNKFNRGNRPPVADRTVGGVWVLYPADDPNLVNAGSMLVWALRNAGIVTRELREMKPLPSDVGVIHAWIGVKP
jgi:hypothetical protein